MNERIRELATQAGWPKNTHQDDMYEIVGPDFAKKFAELIIVKCANIVWDDAHETDNAEVNEVGYKILKHFGVE